MNVKTHLLIDQPLESPIGRIGLAGTIRHSAGISFDNMRILGSYALVYLIAGGGHYADARGYHQRLAAGDLIALFPDIPHAYGPENGRHWDEIYLVFDGPVFDLWRRQGLLSDSRPITSLSPVAFWSNRLDAMIRAAPLQSPLLGISHLQQLLAEMQDHQHDTRLSAADRAWLKTATAMLEKDAHLHECDLESIAQQMEMSYIAFRKKFARLSGTSPAKFRARSLIDRACRLIQAKRLNNSALAAELGFCDEFHFSHRFKQIVGVSPREYRKQISQ